MTQNTEPDRELDELARRVIGAAIQVHKALGPGFLESVYENALVVEMEHNGIKCTRQHPIQIQYRHVNVGTGRLDLLVEGQLIVELKTVESLAPIHTAQVISYLKAMNLKLGLLINFNVRKLKDGIKRIVL